MYMCVLFFSNDGIFKFDVFIDFNLGESICNIMI